MNVLITGAGGFVGGHLVSYLRQHAPHYTLHGTIFNDGERRPALLAACTLWSVDLRQPEAVREVVQAVQPDHIYHLAGQANVRYSFDAAWETLESNIRGTLNIFEAVRQLRLTPRMLVVSSADVYGAARQDQLPLTEESAFNPSSPYSVSKIAQDMLALQYARAHRLHIIRMRPFNHIGPGQKTGFAAADWASQIAEIEAGRREPIVWVGNLDTARDFTDVRDVVRAYALAIERGEMGEVFNVCTGHATPMRLILDTLTRLSTIPIRVEVDPSKFRPVEIHTLYGSNARLRERTGWEPVTPLEQTLQDVLAEWRAQVRG